MYHLSLTIPELSFGIMKENFTSEDGLSMILVRAKKMAGDMNTLRISLFILETTRKTKEMDMVL